MYGVTNSDCPAEVFKNIQYDVTMYLIYFLIAVDAKVWGVKQMAFYPLPHLCTESIFERSH
jgi:hypothetical protein